jgi:hypothetical protein
MMLILKMTDFFISIPEKSLFFIFSVDGLGQFILFVLIDPVPASGKVFSLENAVAVIRAY